VILYNPCYNRRLESCRPKKDDIFPLTLPRAFFEFFPRNLETSKPRNLETSKPRNLETASLKRMRPLYHQLAELGGDEFLQGGNRLKGVAQGILVPRREDARVDVGVERFAPFGLRYLRLQGIMRVSLSRGERMRGSM
jgi:hypothetical protein